MKLTIEGVIRALGATPVPDIADWGKWWSTRLSLLAAALASGSVVYTSLPAELKAALPDWVGTALGGAAVIVAILIPLFRGIEQPGLKDSGKGTP